MRIRKDFLRSETTLIQTIGRAARHLSGRAILYADRITNSIQRALDVTNHRREKQRSFNEEHGITPAGVKKAIVDIMEGAHSDRKTKGRRGQMIAEDSANYEAMGPEMAMKKIKQLEERMYQHARDLEFEDAAGLRDEIRHLQTEILGLPDNKAG